MGCKKFGWFLGFELESGVEFGFGFQDVGILIEIPAVGGLR